MVTTSHEMSLCEKTNSTYIVFTTCNHSHVQAIWITRALWLWLQIWTCLCMLFEVVTIDLLYKTDRQERFDLKISKLKILWKQRHLHLG